MTTLFFSLAAVAVLGGLLGVAAVVMLIVAAVKRRGSTAIIGGVGLAASLLMVGGGAIGAVVVAGVGVTGWVREVAAEAEAQAAAQRAAMQPNIDALKQYEPPDASVPEEFYTFSGSWDVYRVPLVYPYSIETIDTLSEPAELARDTGIGSVADTGDATQQVNNLYDITRLAHDGRWLLLDRSTASGGGDFVLFDMHTGEDERFTTLPDLIATARTRGYTGPTMLVTVESHYDDYFAGIPPRGTTSGGSP